MVDKFRLTNAKQVATSMEPGIQLSNDQGPSTPTQMLCMRGIPYTEPIGSVLWPAIVLRPDIAYAVGVLSQFI